MQNKYFYDRFFNKIKDLYISLSKIKLFFNRIFLFNIANVESKLKSIVQEKNALYTDNNNQTKDNEHAEIWYDALEEQEEEYFDAQDIEEGRQESFEHVVIQNDNIQSVEEQRYENNKYYSLQSGMQKKEEIDNVEMLALAFQIDDPDTNNKVDLSTFKLQSIQAQDEGKKYHFHFTNSNSDTSVLCTENLNMYFPKYFKNRDKSRAEIFPKFEYDGTYGFLNHIVILLEVPKEMNIITGKSWFVPQSKIPKLYSIFLTKYKEAVHFDYDMYNNHISLKLSLSKLSLLQGIQIPTFLIRTPEETNWPIKDILIRGSFANQIGINKIEGNNKKNIVECHNTNANQKNTTGDNHVESIEATPVKDCAQIVVEDVQTRKMKDAETQTRKSQPCHIKEICACVVIAVAVCMSISVYASLGAALAGLIIVEYYLLKNRGLSTQMDEVEEEQPMLKNSYNNICNS